MIKGMAIGLALLVTGCSSPDDDAARRQKVGTDYAQSAEGRAAILQAHRDAVLKRRTDGPASYLSRRYAWIEGGWIGAIEPASGTQMKASFSRDAISTMEIVDAAGRSLQMSQGSMNLGKGTARGTLQTARGALLPYANWTVTPQPDGTIRLEGRDAFQILRRRT